MGSLKRRIFSLLSGMVTSNELSFRLIVLINFLEDLQLHYPLWRKDLLSDHFHFIPYIFNPWDYLITHYSLAVHVFAFVVFVSLSASMIYCSQSFSRGRFAVVWPLRFLRIITVVTTTFLLMPLTETLLHPLKCTNGKADGFNVLCDSAGHIGLIISCGIGLLFILPFGSLMNLLYFDPNPKSSVGKSSGTLDLFYGWTRMLLITIVLFVGHKVASVLNLILIGGITFLTIRRQPFYNPVLNHLRIGTMLSAFLVSICSIGFSFSEPTGTAENIYVAVGLTICVIGVPLGFIGNKVLLNHALQFVYSRVSQDFRRRSIRRFSSKPDVHVSVAQLNDIYGDINRIISTKAKNEPINIFWTPYWVEIACRFIQTAYLDTKAVTFANDIFHSGMKQFPKDARVFILVLYIHI
jgi:hypothetical protein